MNRIYGIIQLNFTPGLKSVLKVNEDYSAKSKIFYSLWLMWDTNKITICIDAKPNKFAILYHVIQGFMNMRQGKNKPNDAFKLCFDNINETM